ncbi:hypothetical protein COY59_02425 [Candidatus Gottesmanbacteria bacterium CG_4_10_14_0_8_um_filter_37_24]|uniref:ABC transporter permease n=1 Tax=Candidatus Gottesmanbacteria bacterium CG_4_10_14_0_8_um_filter_37_24 TaxID=1974574 RepID=A0A2M7RRH0_9BACT|nr:MAG: hypothetical protein COX23_04710 [Candidatus Gottesmanbacteria bacterium CG23_combo_of_CG06-09_8_20_14_all_37_19]PIZ02893.1 MAG: hypothetical protein COY59_02425 [Candidatus Gottesmanbacteria bacterium CG_4_10_14_0_8_um_filter_37_24]
MRKYYYIFKNSLLEYFAYRLNFILWRIRIIVSVLISFFLWQSIYRTNYQVFGYKESQLLTYIILIIFINGISQSTQTFKIAYEINYGKLANILIQPINYFGLNLARDLSDKVLNTLFSLFEIVIIITLLNVPFILQTDFSLIILFIISIILSAILYFEINILLSFIGFWSKEIWAPRFVFYIVVSFLAGIYFPLDILPKVLYTALRILPFPYLVYFPLKIYLGGLNHDFIFFGFFITIIWIILLSVMLKIVWRKGLETYTSEGR